MQVVFVQVSESVPNQMRKVLIHKKKQMLKCFSSRDFFLKEDAYSVACLQIYLNSFGSTGFKSDVVCIQPDAQVFSCFN